MDIRSFRKEVGLTQAQFAEYFEIPLRTLQCWEIGQRKPPDYVPKLIKRIWDLENATDC